MIDGKESTHKKEDAAPGGVEALAEKCDAMQKEFEERFRAMTPEQLVGTYDFLGMFEEAGIILMGYHLVHLIHHRAQMSLYLRLMGASCPSIYGPTADVPFEALGGGGE